MFPVYWLRRLRRAFPNELAFLPPNPPRPPGAAKSTSAAESSASARESTTPWATAATKTSAGSWPAGAGSTRTGQACLAQTTRSAWTARTKASRAWSTEQHPIVLLRPIHAIADAAIYDEGIGRALIEIARAEIIFRARRAFLWLACRLLCRIHRERLKSLNLTGARRLS